MNDIFFASLITPIGAVVIYACLFWLTRRPSRELEEVEAALNIARAKLAEEKAGA